MLKRWTCSKRGLVVKYLDLGFKCINWLRFVRHTLHKMNEMHNTCQDNQVKPFLLIENFAFCITQRNSIWCLEKSNFSNLWTTVEIMVYLSNIYI